MIWALPLLFFLPRSEPVPIVQAGELITVQGTISDYRTEFKGTGRYGGYRYVDGFYLNGESVYYDMPGTSFAPDEFAELVGLYPVTVEYGINAEGPPAGLCADCMERDGITVLWDLCERLLAERAISSGSSDRTDAVGCGLDLGLSGPPVPGRHR